MEKNIKFSVIMPAYNSESYILDAINSVLNQTYKNLELIVINDGSKDKTLEILKNIKDERLKVYSKKNGGYVSAINYGLPKISGDYFLFLGSDDKLDLDLFKKIFTYLSNRAPDMIIFKSLCITPEKTFLDKYSNFDKELYFENTNYFETNKTHKEYVGLLSNRDTSKAYKSSLLGKLRYYGKYGLDSDDFFSMLFAKKSTSYLFIPVVGYYWTLRNESISGKKPTKKMQIDRLKVNIKYFSNLKTFKDATYYEKLYIGYTQVYLNELLSNFGFAFAHNLLIRNYFFKIYRKINKKSKKYSLLLLFPILLWLPYKIYKRKNQK